MNVNSREYQRMAHLLRRAGFGASREEVEAAAKRGWDATLRDLVSFEASPDKAGDEAQASGLLDLSNISDLQLWWLRRMTRAQHPLLEKMTLFWHGHFATAYSKVQDTGLMLRQHRALRRHALGSFPALTLEISRDPAMILYLDNQTNRKGHPNENYARELFELFTLGIGNYTEKDIAEAARAFTGWTFNRHTGEFYFSGSQHDDGPKTVFGKTGDWNGDDIVSLAMNHPACAPFICGKLFRFFIHDRPTPADIKPFADVFRRSKGAIRPVLEAMFRAPVFTSEKAMWGKIKSPVEFVVGSIRTTQARLPARYGPQALKALGQELFNPPNVKGWDGGETWINTTTMLTRFNFSMRLASLNADNRPLLREIEARIADRRMETAEEVVDFFAERILHRLPSPQTRQTLANYLRTGPDGSPQPFDLKASGAARQSALHRIHGLMHIIMLTPEYQLV